MRLAQHARENAVAYLALFVALSGSAWAAATIGPGDIRNNAVLGRHVKDRSLTGADLRVGTLDGRKIRGVDAAALGGIPPSQVGARAGRSSFGPSPCAHLRPDGSASAADCGEVQLVLQHPGRLLVSASANAYSSGGGTGRCWVRSGQSYDVPESEMDASGPGMIARSFVTDPLPAGPVDLKLHCVQGSLNWLRPMISAVTVGNG